MRGHLSSGGTWRWPHRHAVDAMYGKTGSGDASGRCHSSAPAGGLPASAQTAYGTASPAAFKKSQVNTRAAAATTATTAAAASMANAVA